VAAGAAGTAAMTAAQTAYYKATNSESSSTPAEVAKRIIEGVLQRNVPEERMNALNQGMHWLYGSSWGLPYGLVAGSRSGGSVAAHGAALGMSVWAASRAEMTAMQIAPPPWQDPPSSLAMDVGSHLVYGLAAALAFRLIR
jgi:hypothetical protein